MFSSYFVFTLFEFDWDGNAVIGITLKTSPDNRKVTSSKMFTAGLLMKNRRDIRLNRLFSEADKEIRISYMIEESSVFTFNSGTMIGDQIEEQN